MDSNKSKKEELMFTIACDIDGVLADIHHVWLEKYNADYSDSLAPDKILSWDIVKYVRLECGARIFDYLDDPSLYDAVTPIDDSLNGINLIRENGHRVIFVTSAVNGCAGRKLRWLQDWGFFDVIQKSESDYIECHDKSLIRADVLVDDGAHNLRVFEGKRIQFLQPWNRNEFVPGAWLACDWGEVPSIIEDIEDEARRTL